MAVREQQQLCKQFVPREIARDNANLKNERVHQMVYPTRKKAKDGIARHVEWFHNRRRIHSALGYRTSHSARKWTQKPQSTQETRDSPRDATPRKTDHTSRSHINQQHHSNKQQQTSPKTPNPKMTQPSSSSQNPTQTPRTDLLQQVIEALGGPAQVEKKYGISWHAVTNWYTGKHFPGPDHLKTLNEVYQEHAKHAKHANLDLDETIAKQLQKLTDASQQHKQQQHEQREQRTKTLQRVIAALGGPIRIEKKCGIPRKTVNTWNIGSAFPSPDHLETLNTAYQKLANHDETLAKQLQTLTDVSQQHEQQQRQRRQQRQQRDPRFKIIQQVIAALGGQARTSRKCKISRQTVNTWKSGRSFPSQNYLIKLNEAYQEYAKHAKHANLYLDETLAKQLQELTDASQQHEQQQPPDRLQTLPPAEHNRQQYASLRQQNQGHNAHAGPGPSTLAQTQALHRLGDSGKQPTANSPLPRLETLFPLQEWQDNLQRWQDNRPRTYGSNEIRQTQAVPPLPPPQAPNSYDPVTGARRAEVYTQRRAEVYTRRVAHWAQQGEQDHDQEMRR
jgi:hypothetical protein